MAPRPKSLSERKPNVVFWRYLAALYDEAEDWEADILEDLVIRAGFQWRCWDWDTDEGCRWVNPSNAKACENCGRARG